VRLQLGLRLRLGLSQVAGRRLRQGRSVGRCVLGTDDVLGDMHPASDDDWYPIVNPV
jgi:hypothetical protein